jgi:Flp pilus assembly pilin Flp
MIGRRLAHVVDFLKNEPGMVAIDYVLTVALFIAALLVAITVVGQAVEATQAASGAPPVPP